MYTHGMGIALGLLLVLLLQIFGDVVDGNNLKECDIYDGRWVYDNSYPLYNSKQCSNIHMHFDCQKNGRPDQFYLRYRWQPYSCHLPRFNGKEFLERLRNKNILFVGDSISLNQWQSLTCMLQSQSPVPDAFFLDHDHANSLSTFKCPEHNVTLQFSWNSLLVEKESTKEGLVLNLSSISDHDAKLWRQSHVLVFNSWFWWLHRGSATPWDFITDGDYFGKNMDRLIAYKKALTTWARWVDTNIDPATTLVFFRGDTPNHSNASRWGNDDGKQCTQEKLPILNPDYPLKRGAPEAIVEKIISEMGNKKVHLLNITRLSQLRKDGHPGLYGSVRHKGIDCGHWCLPGVPDTWNQLFYAEISRFYAYA